MSLNVNLNLNHPLLLRSLVSGGLIVGGSMMVPRSVGGKYGAPAAIALGWYVLMKVLETKVSPIPEISTSKVALAMAVLTVGVPLLKSKVKINAKILELLPKAVSVLWLYLGAASSWHLGGLLKFAGLGAGAMAVCGSVYASKCGKAAMPLFAGAFVLMAVLLSAQGGGPKLVQRSKTTKRIEIV